MSLAAIAVAALALHIGAARPPFTCGGPYVPPSDQDARGNPVTLEYAVGHASKSAPRQVAEDKARELLLNKLCSLADRATCAPLAAKIIVWESAEGKTDRCAMAVLKATDLEEWRSVLKPDLDQELAGVLRSILPVRDEERGDSDDEDDDEDGEDADEEKPKRKKGKLGLKLNPLKPSPAQRAAKERLRAVVVLGSIDDNGAPGGIRATWLLSRVRAALSSLDVDVRDAPRGWDGVRPPRDVELVVRGELVERVDPARQLPVIDATFASVDRKGRVRAARPVTIPAALAPSPPKPVTAPPLTQGLSVHAEGRAGGSLCPGDYTQVHVTNEIDEDLYVRVLDIDDDGNVLLLFPNESRVDDRVAAGKAVTLSEDGFTVEGAPGARERYIALASKTPDGLGAFQRMRGTCRFKPEDAKRIIKGERLSIAFRAQGGFTFLDDVRCNKPLSIPDKALTAGALADIPWCPPLE